MPGPLKKQAVAADFRMALRLCHGRGIRTLASCLCVSNGAIIRQMCRKSVSTPQYSQISETAYRDRIDWTGWSSCHPSLIGAAENKGINSIRKARRQARGSIVDGPTSAIVASEKIRRQKLLPRAMPKKANALTSQGGEDEKRQGPDSVKVAP